MSKNFKIGGSIEVDTGQSAKSILELKEAIKDATKELENAKIGSKEYIEAQDKIKKSQEELSKSTQENTGRFSKLKEGLSDMVPGFKGASEGANGLTQKLKVLAMNPLVLVFTAIVGVLTLLYNAFAKTREGGEKLSEWFSYFKGAIDAIMRILGNFVVDIKSLGDLFQKLGKLISNPIESIKSFTKEVNKAATATANLKKEQNALERQQINNISINKDLIRQEEALKNIRDDESKSIPVRIKANEDAHKLEMQRLGMQEQAQIKALNLMRKEINLKGGLSKLNNEDLKAYREAEAELADLREESLGRQNEFLMNRNSLINEDRAMAKERRDKAEQDKKEREIKDKEELDRIGKEAIDRVQREKETMEGVFESIAEVESKDKERKEADRQANLDIEVAKGQDLANQVEYRKQLSEEEIAHKQMMNEALHSIVNSAIEIFGEQSAVGKTLAVGMATIDTYSAINKTLSAFAGVPVPGYAIAQSIAIGLAGLLNVKKILGVKVPKDRGSSMGSNISSMPRSAEIPAPVKPTIQTTKVDAQSIQQIGNVAGAGVSRSYVLNEDVKDKREREERLKRASQI